MESTERTSAIVNDQKTAVRIVDSFVNLSHSRIRCAPRACESRHVPGLTWTDTRQGEGVFRSSTYCPRGLDRKRIEGTPRIEYTITQTV